MPNAIQPSLRAAIYARVSTEEQKEGQTIDSQIAELERFAASQDWPVIDVYKDEGWSGALLARPQLDRLRDDASKGVFQIVLINDVDRLARDVSHLGVVKRDLERHGIQVIFRKLPAEKSPTHNLMVNILGSFAEFEREMIADRTRRGRRHKIEVRQQYLGSNTAYGYRYIPKDKAAAKEGYLEVAAEEATVVKQMFDWVDKEGLSAQRVTERLSEMHVPPHKGGKRWGKSSVLRILRCEMYAGVWHYNKHMGCEPENPTHNDRYRKFLKSSTRLRAKSEWIPLILPEELQIIARDQWQRVQQQLDRNLTFSSRNAKHEYLLRGLVRCGGCGATYVGDPGHGVFYYRCYQRCKRFPTIRESLLDAAVWEAIEAVILKPSVIKEQLVRRYDQQHTSAEKVHSEAAEIEHTLEQIQVEEDRILEAYRKGVLSAVQLGRELEQINQRRNTLQARKLTLEKQPETGSLSDAQKSVTGYCKAIAKNLHRFNEQERQRFLRFIVREISFEGSRVRITGALPVIPTNDESAGADDTEHTGKSAVTIGGIAPTTSHGYGRNPVFADYRIATTMGYRHGHNSVAEVPFQVSQNLPEQPLPLKQQIEAEYLRTLIQRDPRCTLKQLCNGVGEEQSITISTTAMCRLVKGYNLQRGRSHRPHTYPKHSMGLAA
jgi:site-specific DNA recombinase